MSPQLCGALAACCLVVLLPVCVGAPSETTAPISPQDTSLFVRNGTESQCDPVGTRPDGSKFCVVRDWAWKCIGYIFLVATVGFVAFALAVPCMLAGLGFGLIGIAEGSLAALFQGSCGTPVCFRFMQSTAMLGAPLGVRGVMGALGFVLGAVAAAYWLPMCYTEQDIPVHGSG